MTTRYTNARCSAVKEAVVAVVQGEVVVLVAAATEAAEPPEANARCYPVKVAVMVVRGLLTVALALAPALAAMEALEPLEVNAIWPT